MSGGAGYPKLAYSIPEAVKASSFSKSELYEAMARGELVARKRGSRTFILARDLRAWLESHPPFESQAAA